MANEVKTELTVEGLNEVDAVLARYGQLEQALKHMTAEERKAYAETLIFAEALDKIEAGSKAAQDAISGWATSIVQLAAAYVGFGAVKHFLTDALMDAVKADDVWQTLHATLVVNNRDADKLGETLQRLGKETEQLTRYTGDQVLAAGNVLSVYKNISDEALPRVIALVKDISRQKGLSELTSQAMQLGRALENPTQATRMLRMAGITLTDQIEDQIKALVESGDVTGAQAILIEELEAKYAGLADMLGGSLSDRLEIVKHRFDEVQKQVGDEMIPVLEEVIPLIEAFGDAWTVALEKLDLSGLAGGFDELTEAEIFIIQFTTALSRLDLVGERTALTLKGLLNEVDSAVMGFFTEDANQAMREAKGLPTHTHYQRLLREDITRRITEIDTELANAVGEAMGKNMARANDTNRAKRNNALKRAQAAEEKEFRAGAGGMLDEFEGFRALNLGAKEREKAAKAAETAKEKAAKEAEKREELALRDMLRGLDHDRAVELRNAERRVRDRRGGREPEQGFQASFEGLTQLYQRISQAAASDPMAKIEAAVRDAGGKNVEALKILDAKMIPIGVDMKRTADKLEKLRVSGLAEVRTA